ncbi:MAG: class I SAM-dependent methyltransferase [Alphaproteobacteria bacterium]|nr:class I SAM-dependent methyltransferase [Alphaproteobacteria bacterium SS10]
MPLSIVPTGKRWRYVRLALEAVFGHGGGFFIPYRYAGAVDDQKPLGQPIRQLFTASETDTGEHLKRIAALAEDLSAIGVDAAAPAPRWNQSWFPGLDAAAYYAMIRYRKPKRIIEVGSGHSTRFALQAISDGDLETKIDAIDPAPRATLANAPDLPITWHGTTVEKFGPAPALEPGDILFIDSSHILMPGSDVDVLFHDWLPSLPPGVVIHIHDIFLPETYPAEWQWRGYNEQPLVAALIGTNAYRILFASAHARATMATQLPALHLPDGAIESSLWLEKY